MLLQFPCGDCVRCNGWFDGNGSDIHDRVTQPAPLAFLIDAAIVPAKFRPTTMVAVA
jgi:hypothetical protein